MHDCRKTEERLMDLVFDELPEDERRQTLAEVESCGPCSSEYQAFRKTLSTFDEAAAAMMPDENYWNGYEARLRTKLAADERPNLWQRWLGAVGGLTTRPVWAMSLAALLLAALLMWAWLKQPSDKPQPPQQAENPTIITPDSKEKESIAASPGDDDEKQKSIPPEPRHQHKNVRQPKSKQLAAIRDDKPARQMKEFDQPAQPEPSPVVVSLGQSLASASVVDDDTLKHFEKAQIFLRAFRNLNAAESDSAFAIADDKQRSRMLLFKNVLLRREAEAKGNRPVEQVLNDLEPLLIDIANLSDKATRDDIRAIRERLQKRELIATLQVYAARPVIARANTD
jgi:hypothetical protein